MQNKDCWILLENEAFVRWILHPDAASDRYWTAWVKQDPQREALVEQARDILLQLQQSPASSKEGLSREIWEGIQAGLIAERVMMAPKSRSSYSGWWAVAATVAVLITVGALLRYDDNRHKALPAPAEAIAVNPIKGNDLIECRNQSEGPQKVYLVDGSIVTLEPHSTLSYARLLDGKTREVTLTGNAYFDIAPDPNHPFLVRSGDLVTRVLGTSFRVMDDPGMDDVHVVVRTGKVSVYKAKDFDNGQKAFCVLSPHQEAVFHKKEQNLAFVPSVEGPLLVPPTVESVSLNFDDEPVVSILDQLEKLYHIHILYNRDSLQQCRLTTSLQDEKLTDQLDIVCRAINASYHTQDDHIVIDGGHCQ